MAHYKRSKSQHRPVVLARPLTDFVGRPGSQLDSAASVKRDARAGELSPREELKICGLAAVKARFERDPASILRLFFDEPTSRKVGAMSQVLAAAKKVYRCVPPVELEKISGSIHHGGIVAIVQVPALRAPSVEHIRAWAQTHSTVLVLDRIGNAHNLGAIARTAAFFGVERIVLAEDTTAARPTEAAHRVAEGGLEYVELWQVKNIAALAKELVAAGYDVIGAATRGGRPEAASGSKKPLALVMGNEERGLSPAVVSACTRLVTIPGTGKVESLNVSVAAAVLLWECCVRRVGGGSAGS
jgi:RNA methyltransferase, TrmH family